MHHRPETQESMTVRGKIVKLAWGSTTQKRVLQGKNAGVKEYGKKVRYMRLDPKLGRPQKCDTAAVRESKRNWIS